MDSKAVTERGPRGPYKISGKLGKALRYLTEGKRLSEAATLSGMTDRGLALALRRPQVASRLGDHARAVLVSQLPKAVATVERVMDQESNPVAALNSAKFALGAAAGITMPERSPLVSINVDSPAGYVYDLRTDAEIAAGVPVGGPVIEHDEREVLSLHDRRADRDRD